MQFVASPVQTPQRCAFLPTISGFHPKGFVEGTELWGGDRAYISLEAVEQIATAYGWAPRAANIGDARRVKELEQRLAERDAELDALRAQMAAVDTLKRMGYQPKRAPGRPRKEMAA